MSSWERDGLRNARTGVFAACIVILLITVVVPELQAQQRVTESDLDLLVDSRWAGTLSGGYLPVRIRARNNAAERQATFEVTGGSSVVSSTMTLPSGSTTHLTLLVPMVGNEHRHNIEFRVRLEGRGLGHRVNLNSPGYASQWAEPAMVVWSEDKPDFAEYDKAVHVFGETLQLEPRGRGYRSVATESDRQWLTPTMMPRSWLAYSGVDFVLLPLSVLTGLEAEEREAILQWVETGGHLMVTQVGEPAADSRELAAALGESQRAAMGPSWLAPSQQARDAAATMVVTPVETSRRVMPGPDILPSPDEVTKAIDGADTSAVTLPVGHAAFSIRTLQQGSITAFVADPLVGSQRDWLYAFRALSERLPSGRRLTWPGRHGFQVDRRDDSFLDFIVPGVESVPIVAFLVLITAFSVFIGPVNFVFLKRRGQLYLLVLTVPVIAAITSVALFGYAFLAHGLGIKSHTRSITFLDQRNESAVTMSRIALFAGMAPGELSFARDTAVYPVTATGRSIEPGDLDWTDRQLIDNAWVVSRTRAQLQTTRAYSLRGRLTISLEADGRLVVENGLEWNLQHLVVRDRAGKLYVATDLGAGDSAVLADPGQTMSFQLPNVWGRTIQQHLASGRISEQPTGIRASRSRRQVAMGVRRESVGDQPVHVFGGGTFSEAILPRSSYAAILDDDPGIERGCQSSDIDGLHLLIGRY